MLKPLEDKIIVKLDKEEEKTSTSGLIIAGSKEERPNEAIVIAVGPGIKLNDGDFVVPEVSVGDRVVFSKYQGTEITHEGEDYLILAYRDIFAIIG